MRAAISNGTHAASSVVLIFVICFFSRVNSWQNTKIYCILQIDYHTNIIYQPNDDCKQFNNVYFETMLNFFTTYCKIQIQI